MPEITDAPLATTTDGDAAANALPITGAPSPAENLVPVAEAVPAVLGRKAIVVVGNHRWDKDVRDTFVIVVEGRTYALNDDGEVVGVTLKTDGYPGGADLYFRTDDSVQFPARANVVTLGRDVLQGHFWGFSANPQIVHVGPAHPAYAAANIAAQRGASTIQIVGLTEREQALIQPYLDALPTDVVAPSQVAVSFA